MYGKANARKKGLQFTIVVDHKQNNVFVLIQEVVDVLEGVSKIAPQQVSVTGLYAEMSR